MSHLSATIKTIPVNRFVKTSKSTHIPRDFSEEIELYFPNLA